MNLDFKINSISSEGVIDFSYLGEPSSSPHEISIIDLNTNLTVHKTNMELIPLNGYWISTGGSNAKRLRNVQLKISNGEHTKVEQLLMQGENRYLVVNSKEVKLNHLGDDLFPIVTEIFYDKVYERDYVRVSKNDVVVDIGANYGVFSLYSINFNPSKVFALEPIKRTFKCLKQNVSEYGVVCVNKAISDKTGYEVFNTTDVNGNNFSVKNSEGFHPSQKTGDEIVETININDFISEYEISHIDFLKVDCEGGELDLFNTIDDDFLKNKIHKIAIEYHSNKIKETILNKLQNFGFVIEDLIGSSDIGLIYSHNPNYTK
jgi:FkbM family methyltransferase